MSISKKIVIQLLSIVLIVTIGMSTFIAQNDTVYACSCGVFDSLDRELAVTDVVFDGIVLSSKKVKGKYASTEMVKHTFHVNGIWQGNASDELTIYSAPYNDSCGFEFEENSQYAVFARANDKGELHTSICSSTVKLHDKSPLPLQLGEFKYTNEHAAPVATASNASGAVDSVVAPDEVKNIVTEEGIKQSIDDRKSTMIVVFATVGTIFLLTAAIIIGIVIRRIRK